MSWTTAYRLALRLLPSDLRGKHGPAMVALFQQELDRARTRGRLCGVTVAAAAIWDTVRRAIYEHGRRGLGAAHPDTSSATSPVPTPTTRAVLVRHAGSFTFAFVALTASFVALFAERQLPDLLAHGAPPATLAKALLYAVPFTAALTIPMAVLLAVLVEFTRLRKSGVVAAARRAPGGLARLVVPVLAAAAGISALAFVVTAELAPRANARLVSVLAAPAPATGIRTLTLGELRRAEPAVSPGAGLLDRRSAAMFGVEIQKKLALPAACLLMAVIGIAIVLSVARGGATVTIAAACAVFGAYYLMMITGESLATRLVISPFVGMWAANVFLFTASLLAFGVRHVIGSFDQQPFLPRD